MTIDVDHAALELARKQFYTEHGAEIRRQLIDAGVLIPRSDVLRRVVLPPGTPILRIDDAGQRKAHRDAEHAAGRVLVLDEKRYNNLDNIRRRTKGRAR